MDSDASASEVESEIIEEENQYDDEVFDEVEEKLETVARKEVKVAAAIGPAPVVKPSTAKANSDRPDDADGDADNYSVDFEEEEQEDSKTPKAAGSSKPGNLYTVGASVVAINEYDYDMASFEEESRSRSPTHSNSPRHLVNLSVPVRADSVRLDNLATSSPGSSSPRSPSVASKLFGAMAAPSTSPAAINYKVLSKPSNSSKLHPIDPQTSASLTAGVNALLQQEPWPSDGDRGLSLLLRKIESKFQDEIEELREKNAVLTWKERELKGEFRRVREEVRIRKTHMDKKRRRALERRVDHDKMVENLKKTVDELEAKETAMQQAIVAEQQRSEQLLKRLDEAQQDRQQLEMRNTTLTERVQSILDDFHALNLKFQSAIDDKLRAEKSLEQQGLCHQVELQAMETKCQLQMQSVSEQLEKEVAARALERSELPETHRLLVEAHKERYERLHTSLLEEKRALETQTAKQRVAMEQEIQRCILQAQTAEEKATKRVQDELESIARERQSVDEQRRELLMMVARTNARFDEERVRLESQRAQMEAKQLQLMQQQADVDAKVAIWNSKHEQLLAEDEKLRFLKQEVRAMSQETYEKSRLVANEMAACASLKEELKKLRLAQDELTAKHQQSESARQALQAEKLELEKVNYELQRERLLVAKQRMESRQLLDGAKKLESLLRQQSALAPTSRAAAG